MLGIKGEIRPMSGKVLVVDDDPRILESYQRVLRKRFSLDTAASGREALEMVSRYGPYAVVVSDMRMPEMSGLDLLMRIREQAPDTVRIMLTGNADQQTAVDAVNRGNVFRFLHKPCSPEVMVEAVEQALEYYREKLKKAALTQDLAERLSYQSKHDILTGLMNRQAFETHLESALEVSREELREHILCYINIDHFRVINGSCGPTAGDELLRQAAQLLSRHCRKSDLVARLSADQFGMLLWDCPLEMARKLVTDVLADLNRHHFEWDGQPFSLGACIGVVPISPRSESVAAILGAAETACNVAKDEGRNRIHIASEKDRDLTDRLDEMQWVARIQKALAEDSFLLYYQPIVPLRPAEEEGDHFEILVRMRGEEGEVIPPRRFFPAAESFHLTTGIDRWVIGAVIEWFEQHQDALHRLALCSINLSGHSLGDQQVLDFVLSSFASSSIPQSKICFEVTETAAIVRMNDAIRFMRRLRREGFLFSLDDFGSGLSSFGYLKNLPVDFLKIDGMFVRNIDKDKINHAIVKSIAEIGRAMGKKTVAEYVENHAVLEQLRLLGVDYGQGYHFSEPRPMDELARE